MESVKSQVLRKSYHVYLEGYLSLSSRIPIGKNIYESDWDAIIILDACRVDALRAVASEYSFLDAEDIRTIRSVGCTSSEWIANTFIQDHYKKISNTAYISSNAWVERVLDHGVYPRRNHQARLASWDTVSLDTFDRVDVGEWPGQDGNPHGLTHPEDTTDRAIKVGRELDPDRLIVHYMPPHAPYDVNAIKENRDRYEWEKYPFEALKNGHDRDEIWSTYLDNLRWGLDAVERLLSNLEAETVILTADHGEGFGEWGMYGHDVGLLSPHIRNVLWVEITATDNGTSRPDISMPRHGHRLNDTATEKLEALGYI